jgi:methylenetetrahydrofolate reductase (NADPH)
MARQGALQGEWMKFAEAYGPGRFVLSFEVFPPKSPEGEAALFRNLGELMAFRPTFVTCTYGAGGSTRSKTLQIVAQVRQRFGVSVATHLTCVGSTVQQLCDYLADAQRLGVENVVALRGDPPRGQPDFRPVAGGLRYANELVALIRERFPAFSIAVAGYPETHQEAPTPQADLENLKRKVDSGADVVITQLFYRNADFFRFRDACTALGIAVPIVPGLLPVTSLTQIRRITALCGAVLPDGLVASLSRYADDSPEQFEVGVEFATRQLAELLAAGLPGVHFYVLNKSPATAQILSRLGYPAQTPA